MSSNNDNAMARFLFAILRQKCLKDIDWNKVAHDPILSQPITNGHAARMRYSRFRSAMLGLEPQRRNRTGVAKSRAPAKPKRDMIESIAKKEEPAVKQDPGVGNHGPVMAIPIRNGSPSRVKQEMFQPITDCKPSTMTTEATQAMFTDGNNPYHTRMLTPCSESDIMMAPQGYAGSPVSDIMHPEPPFDFGQPAHCSHEHGWHHHSPSYTTFAGMAGELDYPAGFCEHNPHQPEELCIPAAVMDTDHTPSVKHEEWDSPYQTI